MPSLVSLLANSIAGRAAPVQEVRSPPRPLHPPAFMPAADRGRTRLPLPLLCPCAAAVLALLAPLLCPARAATTIALGSKLLPSDPSGWVSSPNGSFRLSFFPSPADPTLFSAGVLYNSAGINGTAAWTAGAPSQVDASGSLEFSPDGNLVLTNGSGVAVWNSSTGDMGVSSASMGDDGNFALLSSNGSVLWQSFDNPTDTLVANQRLLQGGFLSAGEYTASLQSSGNLSLAYTGNDGYTYWSSATAGANSSVYASLDSAQATFSIYNASGTTIRSWYSNDYTTTASEPTRRVTLDTDGNLRIYTTSGGNWVIGWEALEDYCQIYAYCGPYGLCGYNESGPVCRCATQAGYSLIDERNPRQGCEATAGNGGQNCSLQSPATMLKQSNTVLFISDTQNRNFRYGDVECSRSCLNNDACTAATALKDGSGSCQLILSNNFYSGYAELSFSSDSYFKFCGSEVPPASTSASSAGASPASGSGNRSSIFVAVVISVLATLALLAIGQAAMWWMFCRRNSRCGRYSAQYALMEYASGAPVQYSYRELRKATGNFNETLGEGSFGVVYKGELPVASSGGAVAAVAVKKLEGLAEHGEPQFRMEVAVIGGTHHVNLVRLCGFCAEGSHRMLVYEYMKNGSLDRHLFVEEGDDPGTPQRQIAAMGWETRYNVLLGTARGITYLHQECRDCIVHSDIKPQNILLDASYTAKVSDFGLARLTRTTSVTRRQRQVSTLVRGTRGYMAPEWRSNLPITVKADVFSYGMVVLETVSGRRSFDATMGDTSAASTGPVGFPEWAYQQFFIQNQVEGVVDERIRDEVDMEQLGRAMKVAFWCLQLQPSSRPSMSRVVQMLDGSMQDIQIPPMPRSFRDNITPARSPEVCSVSSFTPESSLHTSYENSNPVTNPSDSSVRPPISRTSQSFLRAQPVTERAAAKHSF